MGGLKRHLPRTYRTFLVGALAIAGIPPLAGFFSKDGSWPGRSRRSATGCCGRWRWPTAGLTACYMFRLCSPDVPWRLSAATRRARPSARVARGDDRAAGGAGGGRGRRRLAAGPRCCVSCDPVVRALRAEPRRPPRPHARRSRSLLSRPDAGLGGAGRRCSASGCAHARLGPRPRSRRAMRRSAARFPRCTGAASKYWVDELYDATVVRGARTLAAWRAAVRRRADRRWLVNGLAAPVDGRRWRRSPGSSTSSWWTAS